MKPSETPAGLTSIIVPCWNQRHFTEQCLRALKRHTRGPWELIVIDNGSTDDTASYLAGVRDMAAVPVTVVANAKNRGFPAAVNQGLQIARGEYLVLLNNDVVVTDGWLVQMIALANAVTVGARAEGARAASVEGRPAVDSGAGSGEAGTSQVDLPCEDMAPGYAGTTPPGPPFARGGKGCGDAAGQGCGDAAGQGCGDAAGRGATIGLVGPMSNYAAPPQLVESVPYRDIKEMHQFASRWRDEHRGQWFTTPRLSGFCLLMKRIVYDKIGGLDERFGLGFFDDDDLAERARRAGFEMAVALDLFVHHFGSQTFSGNGVDAERLLEENARRFAEKWGVRGGNGRRRVALRPFVEASDRKPHTNPTRQRGTPFVDPGRGSDHSLAPRDSDAVDLASPLAPRDADGTGLTSSLAPRAGVAPLEIATDCPASGPSSSGADRARVSLTMIVKNEEANLGTCLASVQGVFDEIVIVDTGSTDRTIEIARSFGARVFAFPWVDSFSAARNEALSHATGDYAFWLDADDVVEPAEKEKLRGLLSGLAKISGEADGADETLQYAGPPSPALRAPSPQRGEGDRKAGPLSADVLPARRESPQRGEGKTAPAAAYVVRCACDAAADGSGETVVDHVRLFPLRGDLRWTYRVHEQILPALLRARIPVQWTDLIIRHTGYVDPAVRARKLDRDIRLLHLDLADRPDDPFVLFNLGSIAVERHEWQAALGLLERSLAGSAPTVSIVRKLYALIARVHQMLGDSRRALQACARGLEIDSDDAELWFRKGIVHRHRGESAEAERSWRRILGLRRPDKFCCVMPGIYGHLPRRNLAALAVERGDHAEARKLWGEVLAECPGDRDAISKLERLRSIPAGN